MSVRFTKNISGKKVPKIEYKGGGKGGSAPPPPPPAAVDPVEPDLQVTAKKDRQKKRGTTTQTGLNRFLIVPGSDGSGANVPE